MSLRPGSVATAAPTLAAIPDTTLLDSAPSWPPCQRPLRSRTLLATAPQAQVSATAVPTSGTGGAEEWRTPADSGWSAAAAATQPPMAGSTRSGLPKRVPQAQYVPGGVEASSGTPANQRRSPDEVRGLLSAYHRGVQRGREHGGR